MDEMASGTAAVLATMAAPAVLLLANAMLIVSTVQRLQGILARVRETELNISAGMDFTEIEDLEIVDQLLHLHARRAKVAHRALLSFYASASFFLAMIALLGLSTLGLAWGLTGALTAAFVGCALLLVGLGLLIVETTHGIRATDTRFDVVTAVCRRMMPPEEA